ncbi:hypothetical protein [Aquimarina sp. 2201CG14-23]|uniref:hypothetical protein n=1 Tax=Aquimarina mycalae TaxID=3040073 RepID=UPI002477D2B2|nr:hypothetical protein [Aquimarina sp. 2201CG14-23]MDH7447335.1 hypothetical protein [Aquimarina sp. 2201CG14-23]
MNSLKTTITTILVLASIGAYSQIKNTLQAETQIGYEYNYFRSPDEIRTEGVILNKDDLISSSFYQDVELNYKFRYKWNKNRLRVYVNPFSRLFYENFDDSYWSLNVNAKYDHQFNKSISLLSEVRFLRMNREGLGGDQDVLINPLGYTNYGGTLGLELALYRNNELTVEGFYNFKNFDAFGTRDLQYHEYGAQFSWMQVFRVNKLKHKIGVTGYVKKRLYDTFNASDIESNGERDWDYLKGTLFYKLPLHRHFEVKPSFVYYVRIDNSTNRSGFNQYGPGIALKYDNNKTKIRGTFSFITRNYTDIEARNTDGLIGERLQYEYANFQLNGAHKIGNGFSLTATLFSKIRSTNYSDIDARSFRNYRNQYAGIGVLWEF